MATAGYSGTPLPRKLGLKEGGTLVLVNDACRHGGLALAIAGRIQDQHQACGKQ